MPIFLAALLGGLSGAAGSLVGRVLVSLGLGFVTFSGINTLIDWAKTSLVSSLTGLPADAVGLLTTMRVGVAISMLFSALLMRLALNGLTSVASGSVTRMVQKVGGA